MKKYWDPMPRLKALARSAACALTVAALALTAGCGKSGDETAGLISRERVKAGLHEVLEALDRTDETASEDSLVDMTVALELADGSYEGVDLNDYFRDSSIGLKVDAREDRVGLEGDVVVMGDRVIGGSAIFEDGVLGFQVPELDSTYYTVDLEALMSQSEEGQLYMDMMERMGDTGGPDLPTEKLASVLDRYIDVIADTATEENAATEQADFSFEKLPGGKNSGEVWTFTPTARDVEDFLDRLADELENDKDLPALVVDLAVQSSDMMGYTPTDEEKDELREEMARSLREGAEELRQSAEETGRQVEESGFVCTIYSAENGAWKLELSADGARFCAEGGENGFALWADDGRSTPFELVFQYEKEGDAYAGSVTFRVDDGSSNVTLELAFDNVTDRTSALDMNYGSYTVTIPNLGKVYLDVTEAADCGTDHVISLDVPALSQACEEEGMPDFNGARLTIHTTDADVRVPTPDGPSRALEEMDEAELEAAFGPWGQRLEEIGSDLVARLGVDND